MLPPSALSGAGPGRGVPGALPRLGLDPRAVPLPPHVRHNVVVLQPDEEHLLVEGEGLEGVKGVDGCHLLQQIDIEGQVVVVVASAGPPLLLVPWCPHGW